MNVNVIFEGGLGLWEPFENRRGGGGQKSENFANVIYELPLTVWFCRVLAPPTSSPFPSLAEPVDSATSTP